MTAAPQPAPIEAVLAQMLRTVLPAATVPLALFVASFLGWLYAFQTDRLNLAGGFGWAITFSGLLVFVGVTIGGACLLFYVWTGVQLTTHEEDPAPRRRLIKHTGFHATLLILNVAVVFMLAVVAVGLTDRSFVTVDNRSTAALSQLVLTDEAGDHDVGSVPPQSSQTIRVKPASDFTLRGTLGQAPTDFGTFPLDPEGRVRATVTIDADRETTVKIDRRG